MINMQKPLELFKLSQVKQSANRYYVRVERSELATHQDTETGLYYCEYISLYINPKYIRSAC